MGGWREERERESERETSVVGIGSLAAYAYFN